MVRSLQFVKVGGTTSTGYFMHELLFKEFSDCARHPPLPFISIAVAPPPNPCSRFHLKRRPCRLITCVNYGIIAA